MLEEGKLRAPRVLQLSIGRVRPGSSAGASLAEASKLQLTSGAGTARDTDASQAAGSTAPNRAFDVIVACLLLVVLSPLLLAIAAMVRWDSTGPILIAQTRNGLHKRHFRLLKFRTMRVVEDGYTAVQCRKDDPRVTNVGAFLRRTGLDELPQLVNILKGEMSLVGPRPHPMRFDREFAQAVPGYERRFDAVPGITGLAQVRGFRGPIESPAQIRDRVLSDLEYIDNRTAIMDLVILFRTIWVFFFAFTFLPASTR